MELLPFPLSCVIHYTLAADAEPRPFNCLQRVNAAYQALQALTYIFEQGYLYRDLHSGNVRLSNTLQLKLVDFGFVTPQRKSEIWAGCSGYFAPEVMTEPFGEGSEVYSFGLLSMQILTGRSYSSIFASLLYDHDGNSILPADADIGLYPQLQSEPKESQPIAQAFLTLTLACLNRKDKRPCLRETEAKIETILRQP